MTRHAIPFLLALFSNYNFVTIVGISFGEIVLEIAATGHISNAKQLCGYKDHFNYSILAFKSFSVWPCPISCFQRFQLIFFTRPPERGFMKQQSSRGRKIMNGLILYFYFLTSSEVSKVLNEAIFRLVEFKIYRKEQFQTVTYRNKITMVTVSPFLAMTVQLYINSMVAPKIVFLVTFQPYLVENLFILTFQQHARISDFCYS